MSTGARAAYSQAHLSLAIADFAVLPELDPNI
jgi:hypothetical protein